jgi:hypothetical protein
MTETNTKEVQTVEAEVKEGLTWIQKHERFLLVTFGILLVLFLGRSWIEHHYEVAKAEVAAAAKTLAAQQDINKTLQNNYTILQTQTAKITAQMQQQNDNLATQTAAAYKAAAQQAVTDQKLSNDQLAARIDALTSQQGIQSNSSGVSMTHDQSAEVTSTLDTIPALKQQVADDLLIKKNDDTQITSLTNLNTSCSILNSGLQKEVSDEQTKCTAQIKELKAANLKSKIKWTLGGFVLGVIAGLVK